MLSYVLCRDRDGNNAYWTSQLYHRREPSLLLLWLLSCPCWFGKNQNKHFLPYFYWFRCHYPLITYLRLRFPEVILCTAKFVSIGQFGSLLWLFFNCGIFEPNAGKSRIETFSIFPCDQRFVSSTGNMEVLLSHTHSIVCDLAYFEP